MQKNVFFAGEIRIKSVPGSSMKSRLTKDEAIPSPVGLQRKAICRFRYWRIRYKGFRSSEILCIRCVRDELGLSLGSPGAQPGIHLAGIGAENIGSPGRVFIDENG